MIELFSLNHVSREYLFISVGYPGRSVPEKRGRSAENRIHHLFGTYSCHFAALVLQANTRYHLSNFQM